MSEVAERYLRARDVLHAEVEGEEVLLNPRTGVYHLVNRTGRELLVRMEAGDSLESAIHALAEASGEEIGRVRRDAVAFVGTMADRGLLEAAAG